MVKPRGFTLVEMMVTLLIVAILMSAGLITLRGYLPKQRLLSSASLLEGLLQRAQSEASARSYWTCIMFDGNAAPITATLYADVNTNHGQAVANGGCNEGTDLQITSVKLKDDVTFPPTTASNCSSNTLSPCVVWFDPTGTPKLCPNSNCTGSGGLTSCVNSDFQFILSNGKLGSEARAKEIEALSGGLINNVKAGDKGLVTTLWSKFTAVAGGCE